MQALAGELHDLVRALAEVPVPVVAAVRGWAAGAGMSLALAADVAVAGVSTRLRPAYPAIGLSPDGGLTWTLPRAVGPARARHILLTDRVIAADEALALGLVAVVVPDDDVAAEAQALAQRLATARSARWAGRNSCCARAPTATSANSSTPRRTRSPSRWRTRRARRASRRSASAARPSSAESGEVAAQQADRGVAGVAVEPLHRHVHPAELAGGSPAGIVNSPRNSSPCRASAPRGSSRLPVESISQASR